MASPNQPKQMSSRLLTMKFMQRSVAKAAPSTPTGPPAKRMRYSTGASTSGTPTDQELMQKAMVIEEKKRQEAADKEAAAVGETRWYLSFKDPDPVNKKPESMKVVTAGFAELDADDSDNDDDTKAVGRMTFGNFAKSSASRPNAAKPAADSDSDSSNDSDEDEDPASALIREEKRKIKQASQRPASARTPKRVDDEIDLDKIVSISGGRPGGKMSCHICRKHGHMANSCPRRNQGSGGGGGGSGRSAHGGRRYG